MTTLLLMLLLFRHPRPHYPYSPHHAASTTQLDPYGYAIGYCASYAAWWERTFNHTTITMHGNSQAWIDQARQAGWEVGATPHVGSLGMLAPGALATWMTDDGALSWTLGSPTGHVVVVTGFHTNPWTHLREVKAQDFADPYPGYGHTGYTFASQYTFLTPPKG